MELKDKYEIVFSLNAEDELSHILNMLDILYDKEVSTRLYNEINRYLEYLNFFPEMFGWSKYTFHGKSLRKIPVKGYVILYLVDHQNKIVNIIGVFSELEDIDSKF